MVTRGLIEVIRRFYRYMKDFLYYWIMGFKVLIVEDEPLYAGHMEMLLDQIGYECTGIIDNGEDALAFVRKDRPDLILMDINISGEMDGIELGTTINQKEITPIIFVTSLRDEETFKRAKDAKAFGFILKPFDSIQLQRSIELVLFNTKEKIREPSKPAEEVARWDKKIYIKKGSSLEKLVVSEISYVEVEERYCSIYTGSGSRHVLRMSLKELLLKLPSHFTQTHRNYAVNIEMIERVDTSMYVIQVGMKEIPLSKNFKDSLLSKLNLPG